MAKSIPLTEKSWETIRKELMTDYGASILISWKLKKTFGIVARHHEYWQDDSYRSSMYLDFYDNELQTLFLLKYGEFIIAPTDLPKKPNIK